jgi:inorganic pyrophosphatase
VSPSTPIEQLFDPGLALDVLPTAAEWTAWEELGEWLDIVIDRAAGTSHPSYPDMVYPCDYGHVRETEAPDGAEIDVFRARSGGGLVGVIALVHRPSGVSDAKLRVGPTRSEAEGLLRFLDRGSPGPALRLLWRS